MGDLKEPTVKDIEEFLELRIKQATNDAEPKFVEAYKDVQVMIGMARCLSEEYEGF